MAAFVCIYQRDGAPLAPRLLERLAEPLEAYPGETRRWVSGPFGVALRRPFPEPADASPESLRGSPDPTLPPSGGLVASGDAVLALCGRLLPPPGTPPPTPSRGLDDRLLANCEGAFAAVSARPSPDGDGLLVQVVRDPLGSWPVVYHLGDRLFLATSDPAAALGHPDLDSAVDPSAVARFLGFRFAAGGASYFRHLRRLSPGHHLEVGPATHRLTRYWVLPTPTRIPAATDPEAAATRFHAALAAAVHRDTADLSPSEIGLSLSGGLDSAAVASVAPAGVPAFSWTLDATPDADEAARAAAVAEHLRLPWTPVSGDGLHPLSTGFLERFVHVASPQLNPFAALKARLYEAARDAGCRRILVGDGGDVVYGAGSYWLRDLFADHPGAAWGELGETARRALAGERAARLALARLAPAPIWSLARRLRPAAPWLTAEGRRRLPAASLSPILPPGPLGHRLEMTLGSKNSELESEEQRLFALCGVERANPFWSWPLLTQVVGLPAYLLRRGPRYKPLARLALAARLPASILDGGRVGLLGEVYLQGLRLHRERIRQAVFTAPRSDWKRYVRRDAVEPYLDATGSVAFGHTLLWRLISYEAWYRRLAGDPLP